MKVQCRVNAYYQRLTYYYYFSIVRTLQNSKNSVICYRTKACSKCVMIRPRQDSLAILSSSTPTLSLLVFIYATSFWSGNSYARNLPKVVRRTYSDVFFRYFKFLSAEFGENLDWLQLVVHKLFVNLTFLQKSAQNGHLQRLRISLYCDIVLYTCFQHVSSSQCL